MIVIVLVSVFAVWTLAVGLTGVWIGRPPSPPLSTGIGLVGEEVDVLDQRRVRRGQVDHADRARSSRRSTCQSGMMLAMGSVPVATDEQEVDDVESLVFEFGVTIVWRPTTSSARAALGLPESCTWIVRSIFVAAGSAPEPSPLIDTCRDRCRRRSQRIKCLTDRDVRSRAPILQSNTVSLSSNTVWCRSPTARSRSCCEGCSCSGRARPCG